MQIFKEGEAFIAYTPALDLSTYADNMDDLQKRFSEAVEIFLEIVINKGTLEEVLTDLGWTRKDKTLNPPVFIGSQVKSFNIPREIYA